MKSSSLLAILLFAFAATFANGQTKGKVTSAKVLAGKPGVYIDELHPEAPLKAEVWLRLHNNYKWGIAICQFDDSQVKLGILGLNYEMERIDPSGMPIPRLHDEPTFQNEVQASRRGNPADGDCEPYILAPGKMISFRINRNDLIRWARVRVPFFMQWEDVQAARRGEEPQHAAYFYSRRLTID